MFPVWLKRHTPFAFWSFIIGVRNMTSLRTGTKEVVAQTYDCTLKKSSVNLWKFSDLHFNHITDQVLKQSVPLLNRNL